MRLLALLICSALNVVPVLARAAEPVVPIDAFVEQMRYSKPRISPDGKHIAISVRIERGDRTVPTMTVYSLPDLKIVSTIALPGFEVPVNFQWISSRRLIVEKGLELGLRERPRRTGEVVAVDLDGTKPQYLYGYNGFQQSSRGDRYGDDYGWGNVEHIPLARDGHVFLGGHLWRSSRSMLYDIQTSNSVRKLLADIPMKDAGFIFQNDATPRFAYGDDDDNQPFLYRLDDASGEWRRLERQAGAPRFHPIAFTPDNSEVYAWQSVAGGPWELVRENMKTGARTAIAKDPVASIEELHFGTNRSVPFAYSATTGKPVVRYLDENNENAVLHKTLSAQFPGEFVHFLNSSDDGQKLLFSVASDRDPGSFYLFDKQNGKAELLFSNMERIDPEQMAERRPIKFVARDGLTITGYLTVPKNPSGKKLPMVLLPHGGPFDVADSWYFDEDAQFLASRGYAVLQVNFRGSSGRGPRFERAGYRQWGGKLLDDLSDGVKWANGQPDIDASRVCVFGASYGGYAALMLPVREPAMFKCSVGYVGMYDLSTVFDQEGVKGNVQATNFFMKTLGKDPAELAANSPVNLAEKIKVPVLLVHGNKDKITPLAQAETMRDALTRAGRPPQWMLVKGEGHGFYDAEHRKQFYEALEAFLDKHIGH
ncbi:S9 family peptidase [Massilia sp. R2A-15]|uniref:S9 family peptidase n=1 Tax=Massilia sp. R2A-15 TaxID=3064278 RepID=UPI002734BE59|nr:S9 family peptidase [Massilia sp. R2A-15]WLI87472.1 S9 family peptidase [Massilia sp. R2A-15]